MKKVRLTTDQLHQLNRDFEFLGHIETMHCMIKITGQEFFLRYDDQIEIEIVSKGYALLNLKIGKVNLFKNVPLTHFTNSDRLKLFALIMFVDELSHYRSVNNPEIEEDEG